MKPLRKLLLPLFIAAGLLIACHPDEPVGYGENSLVGKSRIISFEELKSRPKAVAKLKEVLKGSKGGAKDVHYSGLNFTVSTGSVLLFELGAYESLTFTVIPDTYRGGYLENLVLVLEDNTEYSAYLTVYNFTEDEREAVANDAYVDQGGKAAMFPLGMFDADPLKNGDDGIIKRDGKCYKNMWVRVQSFSNIPGQLEESKWEMREVEVPCPEENIDLSFLYNDYNNGGGSHGPMPHFETPRPVYEGPVTEPDLTMPGGSSPSKPKPAVSKPFDHIGKNQ